VVEHHAEATVAGMLELDTSQGAVRPAAAFPRMQERAAADR
jgi:hypothetical protein